MAYTGLNSDHVRF